jgi:uncharacterized iron-regulated protein
MKVFSAIAVLVAAAVCTDAAHAAYPAYAQQDTVPRIGEYRVYSGSGDLASLDAVVTAMAGKEVVFIGESHDDLTGHHVELELLSRAFAAYGAEEPTARPVTLSLEMFERDVQYVVNEYLQDQITEDQFRKSGRQWPEYETDYRPMIEFAKEQGLAVVAANAPRRYANRVTRLGREALLDLSPQAQASLPPLPYGMPSALYREQFRMAMVEAMQEMRDRCTVPPAMAHAMNPDSAPAGMPMRSHSMASDPLNAQALWDASMAYSISQHLMQKPDALVLHMVGSFHVEQGTGTPEHLARYRPGTSTMIVVIRPVENVDLFDSERDGENEDFVILTDEALTRPPPACPVGR